MFSSRSTSDVSSPTTKRSSRLSRYASSVSSGSSTRTSNRDSQATALTNFSRSTTSLANPTSPLSPFPSDVQLPLSILTKGTHLDSGFPYDPALFHLRVAPDRWEQFQSEIIEDTTLSLGQRAMSVGTTVLMAVHGFPAAGVYTGRQLRHKMTIKKVKKSGLPSPAGSPIEEQPPVITGLAATLSRWNDDYFNDAGLEVSLVLPPTVDESMREEEKPSKAAKLPWKKEVKEAKRFRLVITRKGEADSSLLESPSVQELPGDTSLEGTMLSSELDSRPVSELPSQEPTTFVAELEGTIPQGLDEKALSPYSEKDLSKEPTPEREALMPRPLDIRKSNEQLARP